MAAKHLGSQKSGVEAFEVEDGFANPLANPVEPKAADASPMPEDHGDSELYTLTLLPECLDDHGTAAQVVKDLNDDADRSGKSLWGTLRHSLEDDMIRQWWNGQRLTGSMGERAEDVERARVAIENAMASSNMISPASTFRKQWDVAQVGAIRCHVANMWIVQVLPGTEHVSSVAGGLADLHRGELQHAAAHEACLFLLLPSSVYCW